LAGRLRQALAQLSETDAEILLMRTLEGLTNKEVAQVLGIDVSAASKRYGRAILKLRQILFDTGLSESKIWTMRPSSRRVQLLQAATNLPLATLETPNADPVEWLDFSADGSQLIVVTPSPGCVRIWDLRAIRGRLAQMALDWKLAPYAAAAPPSTPLRLDVRLGSAQKTP
jgi:Sigma-70, region 4